MKRILSAIVLVFGCSTAWAQSPCDGRVTDQLNHSMDAAAVPKPAPGGSYVDPAFGTKIIRITNADPLDGTSAVMKTTYNTMRGWNADESMILVWNRANQGYEIYEGDKPYGHLFTLLFGDAPFMPDDIEDIVWDPVDPNVLYYPGGWGSAIDPQLIRVTFDFPNPATFSSVHNFASLCDPYSLSESVRFGSDPHDMAIVGPEKFIGLMCGEGTNRLHILYSITNDQVMGTYEHSNSTAPWAFSGGAYRSADGTVFDTNLVPTGTVLMPPDLSEHSALTEVPGAVYYGTAEFGGADPGTFVTYNMATGARTPIIAESLGWPYPKSGTHPSRGAKNSSGWIAVSSLGNGLGQTLLENELLLANVITGEVCRIAHVRSFEGTKWDYWGEPHPQVSGDAYRVLFTSDWNDSDTVDTYVVDLRSKGPSPVTYRADLTWTDNADNEDGTRIERSPETLPRVFAQIGSVAANVAAYVDQPISEGESFCWRLIAFNGGGDSAPSAEACATASPPVSPPISPSGLTADVTLVP